jgi:hypothetical protein
MCEAYATDANTRLLTAALGISLQTSSGAQSAPTPCWLIQGLPVNGTAQTTTSGSRRIGTRVAGALRRTDAAPQYEVALSPD